MTCAEAIADARISLNVMPWFKDGTHDRVFTAMLQHTLSLTDDSGYLRENFTDKKELVFYSLEKREELPELVKKLLENRRNVWKSQSGDMRVLCGNIHGNRGQKQF